MLKVVHVCETDLSGGAALAGFRIHTALRSEGIDSRFVALRKLSADPTVDAPLGPLGMLRNLVNRTVSKAIRSLELGPEDAMRSVNVLPSGLGKWLERSDADVVNLHWVGADTLSIREIGAIRKPLVWTLHDMWPFCGGEHYDSLQYPNRFRDAYRSQSRPPITSGLDVNAWTFRRKQRRWRTERFHLVCPSAWLADQAAHSTLCARSPTRVIPNCVDLDVFRPRERAQARAELGLPHDKRLVLFGSASGTKDRRKGFEYLVRALETLAARGFGRDVELLVFGASEETLTTAFKARNLGRVTDSAKLATAYSAADVFAMPSLQDNLPNTLIESLACGTPCAAFGIGGVPEIVDDGITGHLAAGGDANALADAIAHTLSMDASAARSACRQRAERSFSGVTCAKQYADLYRSLVGDVK